VQEQAKKEAEARAERRKQLLRLFEERMASLAFKGGRRRTASCSSPSGVSTAATSPARRRARSCDAAVGTLTTAVIRAAATPTATPLDQVQEGDTEGIDGVFAQGQQEGREQEPSIGEPEQEKEEVKEEVGNKANTPLDVIVSTDQPIKLAIIGNTALVSPRGCASPTTNLASSEDIVRQASSSGATEQAPSVEGIEGAGEDDLQEQEGALDVSQEEEATQQEELPASSVDMSDTDSVMVLEKEGEVQVEAKDDVPQEHEDTAPYSVKEKVRWHHGVMVINHCS
jgi:hypothetical protein